MGNKNSLLQKYENYHISLRLYQYVRSFQIWIEKCTNHPYHRSVENLFTRIVNKIDKVIGQLTKETEELFIVKLKEIEVIIEKYNIGYIQYMDEKIEIKSSLNHIVYLVYKNKNYYEFNDLLSELDLYLDYTELRFHVKNKIISFNDVVKNCKSNLLVDMINSL